MKTTSTLPIAYPLLGSEEQEAFLFFLFITLLEFER